MNNEKGFTTVEILSTLVIVVIIISGILSAYTAIQKTSKLTNEKFIANMIATNQMEEMRSNTLKGNVATKTGQVTEKDTIYTYNVTATETSRSPSGTTLFLLKSSVSWGVNTHTVEINSYITTR